MFCTASVAFGAADRIYFQAFTAGRDTISYLSSLCVSDQCADRGGFFYDWSVISKTDQCDPDNWPCVAFMRNCEWCFAVVSCNTSDQQ